MRRIIVVCEGPTEQEFCNKVLAPHLLGYDKSLSAPVVKKSGGGIVSWAALRTQILNHLREHGTVVSMLVDYYGIKDNFLFPGWEASKLISNKHDRMNYLFNAMKEDIDSDLQYRFIPYMQLHEFEGLLFSDIKAFQRNFTDSEMSIEKIARTIQEHPNPEEINNSPQTAPSKRLLDAIPEYNKVVYGSILAEDIGLNIIRSKCPLFDEWVRALEHA